MLRYLRENWLWIAVPFVSILVLVLIVLAMSEGDEGSMFTYSVFGG